jgi:tRNA (cytidine/uridine-2'-O-)-methyltransferase
MFTKLAAAPWAAANVQVVLVYPEIPPNTGNIMRLCANTGAGLHLIEPLGFPLDHAKMRRAGLDYREYAQVRVHPSWEAFLRKEAPRQLFAFTTKASRPLFGQRIAGGSYLVFGSETRGLPPAILDAIGPAHCLRLPMMAESRSLNLSNAVAVSVYEVWRQHHLDRG